jgi:hypothetical protein
VRSSCSTAESLRFFLFLIKYLTIQPTYLEKTLNVSGNEQTIRHYYSVVDDRCFATVACSMNNFKELFYHILLVNNILLV